MLRLEGKTYVMRDGDIAHFGGDPEARDQYEGEPWFDAAAQFADEWDQTSFDPDYDTLPLEHFVPMVHRMFARPPNSFV